jgi:hypothetical protein
MTVVLSISRSDMIIMAADSVVVFDFGDSREYMLDRRKAYMYPGVGGVTTWGSRDGNKIGQFLDSALENTHNPNVTDLANLTFEFLTNEYRPDELNLDSVGYHVAGFNSNQEPKLYHVFWGYDRVNSKRKDKREYKCNDHSPSNGEISFVYNGRNDLAETVIKTFLSEVESGADTKLNIESQFDLILLADLTLRFSSEITPQVGPPFIFYLLNRQNKSQLLRNNHLCPINHEQVSNSIDRFQRND